MRRPPRKPWERRLAFGNRFGRTSERYLLDIAEVISTLLADAAKPMTSWEAATGAIIWSSAHRARLIAWLLRDSHVAEGAILARTLIDLAVSSMYLLAHTGARREHVASRFIGFEPVQFGEFCDRNKRKRNQPRELDHEAETERRKVTGVFADIAENARMGWAGKSPSQMIAAIRERAVRETLEYVRTRYGFLFSAFVHPTPMGVGASSTWDPLVCSEIGMTACTCALLYVKVALPELAVDTSGAADRLREATSRHEEAFDREMTRLHLLVPEGPSAPLPLFDRLK